MTTDRIEPLYRVEFDAQELMAEHPLRWQHPNKEAVFAMCCPEGCRHGGRIACSRWAAMPLPETVDAGEAARTQVVGRADVFDYAPALSGTDGVEWHLNFAAADVFAYYRGGLFAQDEMQVTEHPALAAAREGLLARRLSTMVVERGRPTPILVRGVERRCRVATAPDPSAGRTFSLYGNNFAAASVEDVRRAVTVLDPPTISNILAIEAPSYGRGAYSTRDIRFILETAYTGFRAAVAESSPAPAAVHTGFWGCGVYGGNRTLMALLQILAARMSGASLLVFHAVSAAGLAQFSRAEELAGPLMPGDTETVIDRVVSMDFAWGTGDGN